MIIHMKCHAFFSGEMKKRKLLNVNYHSEWGLSPEQHFSRQLSKLYHYLLEKIRLGISCELSAMQTIQMICQALISLTKNKQEGHDGPVTLT